VRLFDVEEIIVRAVFVGGGGVEALAACERTKDVF
jgi:hypothetical protein